ncbi:Helicase associated domain protein [Streptomyces sp. NPDC005953]|uniref:DEAD/DEAH box helicase n=1 Tax=Streptomyces sp. NPDC005953 TaxID=3156719 RepID=UPI00340CD213
MSSTITPPAQRAGGPLVLRPYQATIVRSVVDGLGPGGLGQVRMACGSGKTIVAQRAAEGLLPEGGTVAVLVPSLALAAQTLASWSAHPQTEFETLVVCSDDTVADTAVRAADLPVPVTTDTDTITAWLARTPARPGLRLVLCTYRSAPRLGDAVQATGPLDLVIMDEAHHLAGRLDSVISALLAPHRLPAVRRLFMTATPREDLRIALDDTSLPMVGMDDPSVFGPVLGSYTFAQGIAEGYLEDYRLVVIGIRDSEARRLLGDTSAEYVDEVGAPSLQTIAAQVALARAREQFGTQRVLTFHPRVEAAAEFARSLGRNLDRIAPGASTGLYAAHVHGEMDHRLRGRVLRHLERTDSGWTVISSARVLGEGVDLPSVDAVLFGHPKRSAVDITQAVGRALRKHPDTPGPSTIIVPLVVPDEDGEIGDLDAGSYETLWQVVRALRAHDDDLGSALDHRRYHGPSYNPSLPDKITIMLPPGSSQDLLTDIRLLLVRQTTSPWWEGYNAAADYFEQEGNLGVAADHRTAGGFRLGAWIAQRRYEQRLGRLNPERIAALDTIGMVWDPAGDAFAANLQAATAYHAQHGDLRFPPTHQTPTGVRLGVWLSKQRGFKAAGTLSPERQAALDALDSGWALSPVEEKWHTGLREAHLYQGAHGALDVHRDHVTATGHPLGQWLRTQRGRHRKGELPADRVAALDELGMVWDLEEHRWQQSYNAAVRYHATAGNLDVPHGHVTPCGVKLGAWLLHQRQLHSGVKKGGISPERTTALDALGMRWTSTRQVDPRATASNTSP